MADAVEAKLSAASTENAALKTKLADFEARLAKSQAAWDRIKAAVAQA